MNSKSPSCDSTDGRLSDVSIIVPLAPGEHSWKRLLQDLSQALVRAEVILVGAESADEPGQETIAKWNMRLDVNWAQAPSGRGRQLNRGAQLATREFLWFLHADTRVSTEAVDALANSLSTSPESLHYFRLQFDGAGPRLTRWNAVGANLRSRWLGMPFGDQGFCLSRTIYQQLGGYDENLACGEDHHFVWAARRRGVSLKYIGKPLVTSARKYASGGWLRTTCRHVWLTWQQALPEWVTLIQNRWSGKRR